jgi:hypothetical protein
MSSDDSDGIDLSVDPKDLLPQVVLDEWLPHEEESILSLFQFNKYPPCESHYILPSNLKSLLHQDPIQSFDYHSLLTIGPPALPSISKAYKRGIKKSKHPILSVTLTPSHGDSLRLPTWIFCYWTEIMRAMDIRKQWKVALTWVQITSGSPLATEPCQALLLGLSSFSWSHGAAYTKDITRLLSNSSEESYLSSYHIDHMMSRAMTQYQEQHGPDATRRHIFAMVDLFNAINCYYGKVHTSKSGWLWENLKAVEDRVVVGEIDSICGVMHLHKHWVSVVIDFQQQQILYGDSLGQPMPKREHYACKRWVKHLITQSAKLTGGGEISNGVLPTGCQKDGTSCGLFALNSITHHYLGYPLLPSDPVTLSCRRMEITLDIIGSMTVCFVSHSVEYGII